MAEKLRQPKEIAYFVRGDPQLRVGIKPSKLFAQSEDVLVDRHRFIHSNDKNHGVHILRVHHICPYCADLKPWLDSRQNAPILVNNDIMKLPKHP